MKNCDPLMNEMDSCPVDGSLVEIFAFHPGSWHKCRFHKFEHHMGIWAGWVVEGSGKCMYILNDTRDIITKKALGWRNVQ